MKPKSLWFCSLAVVLLVSSCFAAGGALTPAPIQPTTSLSQTILDYFPLKKGAYWVYQGPVRWTKPNSSDLAEAELTWKMQVEQVIRRDEIVGYEMTGAPWDLAWYDLAKEPSKYGILQEGNKFYRVPTETVARLSNEQDDLSNLVNEGSIFLDTPLEAGKKFGNPAFLARSDNMYCWIVGEMKPFDASGIKGVDPSQELQEYPVAIQTNPDVSTVYFVPGVGISHYLYRHHGTVSEVDVHLIEYSPGE